MANLKRLSLPDQLYEQLRRRIIALQMPLGSRLNASELQKEFGVSSTPVREALNRLAQEGLIVYKNNIGAHVLSLTEQDVGEITEVNFALQAEAVRLAARRGKSGRIAEKIDAFVKECEAASDEARIAEIVTRISELFFACAGNKRLYSNSCGLAAQQTILINLCLLALKTERENFATGLTEYRFFADALRDGDLNRAIDLLEKISYTGRDFSIRGLRVLQKTCGSAM